MQPYITVIALIVAVVVILLIVWMTGGEGFREVQRLLVCAMIALSPMSAVQVVSQTGGC